MDITSTLTLSTACLCCQELPEKWKSLKKIAFTVKHEVAPLQSNEVAVIRRKCARFEVSPQRVSVCAGVSSG